MCRYLCFIKFIFLVAVVCLQTAISPLVAQDKTAYSELELYRQTLEGESATLYKQALEAYESTPHETAHYSTNKQLIKLYHQLTSLADSTAEQLNYKIEALRRLALDAADQQETGLQLRSLTEAFQRNYSAPI